MNSGDRLGRYVLSRKIGAGGMGELWEAADETLMRRVAIKIIRPELAQHHEVVQRFLHEARAVARLRHEHIVPIYEFGVEHTPHFVMPLLTGGTLEDRLRGGIEKAKAMTWLRQIASALDFSHSQGVIHRDVKPPNVLFDEAGKLLVTDFGIARIADATRLTLGPMVMGTYGYMAPEQAKGEAPNAHSDQYALAVVAFRMLTGRLPFTGSTPESIIHKTIYELPPAATSIRGDLPAAIDSVLATALAKDPGERYASCSAFADAVAETLGAEALGAGALDSTVPLGPAAPSRRPRLVAGVAVATAAVLGTTLFLLLPSRQGVGTAPRRPPVRSASTPPRVTLAVYRKTPRGAPARADAKAAFHSGDGIRFGVSSTEAGHLYLLLRASSGRLLMLYPDRRIGGGTNSLEASQEVLIPAEGWFVFDETPGVESVYAYYSKVPDPSLVRVLQSAASGGIPEATSAAARLQARSRDLVLTAPDQGSGGPADSNGMPASKAYSMAGQGDLVGSLQLSHE